MMLIVRGPRYILAVRLLNLRPHVSDRKCDALAAVAICRGMRLCGHGRTHYIDHVDFPFVNKNLSEVMRGVH